eukprot:TRINITY_DN54638_c0_g2_i1.p1 TRINITY_DN54638_c0_g2~~TRINITY_DN54638_c0_g2_i1.p1  ORF type:complete len:247 (-),score=11.02 TRINITY_DN54638_c0_g2_i1:594-1334(-)
MISKTIFLQLFFCAVIMHATSAGSHSHPGPGTSGWFKCRRSIDKLMDLSMSELTGDTNCKFGSMSVLNATVTAVKGRDGTPSLQFELEATLERQMLHPQFLISMSSVKEAKTIKYSGHEGRGYDMCCNFINNATCKWVKNNSTGYWDHNIQYCPVAAWTDEQLEAREKPFLWTGKTIKPLHVLVPELWEVRFTINDGFGQDIGQVLAWAWLKEEDINTDSTSGALVPGVLVDIKDDTSKEKQEQTQ